MNNTAHLHIGLGFFQTDTKSNGYKNQDARAQLVHMLQSYFFQIQLISFKMSLVFHSVAQKSISSEFYHFYRFLISFNTVPSQVLQKIMLLEEKNKLKK